MLGITTEMVDLIPEVEHSDLFTDEERAVVAASAELTKTATLSDAMFRRLRARFTDEQIVTLLINTSIANLNNRVTDALSAEVEDAE